MAEDLFSGVGKEPVKRITEASRGWIVPLAKFGYIAKGIVYIVIGILATMAAFRIGGKTSGSRGALGEIFHQPYGQIMLGAIAFGLFGYAVWRLVQAVKDTENKGSDAKGIAIRIGYALVGFAYLGLSYSAVRLIMGQGGSSNRDEQAPKEWTATLLEQPFGQFLVVAVGAGIIGFAIYQLYKAYKSKFRENFKINEMDEKTERFATRVGQIGLASRALVFAVIGFFIIQAAFHSNPGEARGLGGALQALENSPFGSLLLAIIAVGLIVYGIYMFVLAKYRRFILD